MWWIEKPTVTNSTNTAPGLTSFPKRNGKSINLPNHSRILACDYAKASPIWLWQSTIVDDFTWYCRCQIFTNINCHADLAAGSLIFCISSSRPPGTLVPSKDHLSDTAMARSFQKRQCYGSSDIASDAWWCTVAYTLYTMVKHDEWYWIIVNHCYNDGK